MEQQTTQILVVDDNPKFVISYMFYWKGKVSG